MWQQPIVARSAAVVVPLDPPHRHLNGCFWDAQQCRWHCSPRGAAHRT
jgi:hypothetical protein